MTDRNSPSPSTCAHESCTCTTDSGSTYCSDHCSSAASEDTPQTHCGCGHPGCG